MAERTTKTDQAVAVIALNYGGMARSLNPSRALLIIGVQLVASLNLRFDTRWLRARNIKSFPNKKRSMNVGDRNNHLRPTVSASTDTSSRRCSGSSSTML